MFLGPEHLQAIEDYKKAATEHGTGSQEAEAALDRVRGFECGPEYERAAFRIGVTKIGSEGGETA